jgi:hypothetical protein
MTTTSKKVVLDQHDTFTTAKLVEYLNENYTSKKTGEPFTSNDIQQYIRRKKLPAYVGGHPLSVISDDEIGLKLLKVNFKEKAKRTKNK